MVDQGTDPEFIQNAPKENIIIDQRESFNDYFYAPSKGPSYLQQ